MSDQRHQSSRRSRYRGVAWDGERGKWVVSIGVDGKTRTLGRFAREDVAATAWNVAAYEAWGERARLNVVHWVVKWDRVTEWLSRRFPERAKRVRGWVTWPHDRDEIRGIRHYMETGDDSSLPAIYRYD